MRSNRFLQFMACGLMGFVPALATSAPTEGDGLSLKLSIAADQPLILPLLPVVLRIELANEGGTTQVIAGAGLDYEHYGYIQTPLLYLFHVQGPDGSTKTVHFSDWVGWLYDVPGIANPPQSLAAGHSQVLEYTLGLGVEDFSLPKPEYPELQKQTAPTFAKTGEYQIQLALPRFSPPVRSNVLTIRVREPENPEDVLAHYILSHSGAPELFFRLPGLHELLDPRGITTLDSRKLRTMRDSGTTPPLQTCRQILAQCPGSTYAPYARLSLAVGLCFGWEEDFAAERGGIFNLDRQIERVRFLHQTARDVALPLRQREQAWLILRRYAERIDARIKSEARRTAPSLEQVLGVERVDLGGIPSDMSDIVFRVVFDTTQGSTVWKDFEDILNSRLTPGQMEMLRTAVTTNDTIQQAYGFSPLQIELQGCIDWVQQELCKLPWRDPLSGDLTMAGRPLPPP